MTTILDRCVLRVPPQNISNLELLLAFCGVHVHRYSQKKKIRSRDSREATPYRRKNDRKRQRLRELSRCLSMLSSWSGRFSRKPREWIYHLDINGLSMWTPGKPCNAFLSLELEAFLYTPSRYTELSPL